LPAIGDRHLVEFLPGFLGSLEQIERHGLVRTSIADRQRSRDQARARLERQLGGHEELALPQGSDDVAGWVAALAGGPPIEDNLNAPNRGQIPQLPAEAVVETRGLLDGAGFHPLVSPLPPALEAIVRPHVLREELSVEAALEGSFAKALAALTTDPLLPHPDCARPLLEELIAGTRPWLPRFHP
jgi:alpha-galactosidase/6-phospho-beta-glucosidase family protein